MVGGETACRIMLLAFSHGAYVAGGMAKVMLNIHKKEHIVDHYISSNNGDIDLFFQDQCALTAFWTDFNSDEVLMGAQIPIKMIPPGPGPWNATELVCNHIRIQVINRYVGPIIDQLNRFDIFNAMVAFNLDSFIIPVSWRELEEHRLLHVVNWSSIFVIHRLSKWKYKHNYMGLSPKTASEIGEVAMDIIQKLKVTPHLNPWGGTLDHRAIADKLKQFMPYMTNDQLLLLSSIEPTDAYDGAFGILQRRSESSPRPQRG